MRNHEFAPVLEALANARSVLLFAHMAPDPDCIGSMLALRSCLRQLGKNAQMCCQDPIPADLQFLPGWEQIQQPDAYNASDFDLALSIDSSDLERLGTAGPLFMNFPHNIQMDHHRTNTRFASINVVLDHLPASGCLVYRFFEAAKTIIDEQTAVCLYSAISADTGNFCFGQLTDEVFEQMVGLMRAGLPIVETARALHLMKQREHVLLLGRALNTLSFDAQGQLASMHVRKADFAASGAGGEHSDRIVNYGLYLPGVRMCYLASETEEGVKFSFRSIAPYRVDELALSLGGGGHAQASGCTLQEPWEQAVARVHARMRNELNA